LKGLKGFVEINSEKMVYMGVYTIFSGYSATGLIRSMILLMMNGLFRLYLLVQVENKRCPILRGKQKSVNGMDHGNHPPQMD